jgi:hypothetical protein
VNEIETITDGDRGQLVREFGFLEEVLDLLGIIVIALAAYSLTSRIWPVRGAAWIHLR